MSKTGAAAAGGLELVSLLATDRLAGGNLGQKLSDRPGANSTASVARYAFDENETFRRATPLVPTRVRPLRYTEHGDWN